MTERTDERCLSDPYFWKMFFTLFCNESMVLEFSEVSKIPAEHIRAARRKHLVELLIKLDTHYFQDGTNSIN